MTPQEQLEVVEKVFAFFREYECPFDGRIFLLMLAMNGYRIEQATDENDATYRCVEMTEAMRDD